MKWECKYSCAQVSKGYIPTWRQFRASALGRRWGNICETPSSSPQMKRNIREGLDSKKGKTELYTFISYDNIY